VYFLSEEFAFPRRVAARSCNGLILATQKITGLATTLIMIAKLIIIKDRKFSKHAKIAVFSKVLLMTTVPTSTEPAKTEIEPTAQKSRQQPAWHVVLLSVFTLSFYLVYWFYKTVRDLRSRAIEVSNNGEVAISKCQDGLTRYLKANPFWLTVALVAPTTLGPFLLLLPAQTAKAAAPLIPLLTLGFFVVLFYDIARVAREGSLLKNNPTFPAFCLVAGMAMLWSLGKMPSYFSLLFTLVSIPPAIAQHWINDYWQRVEPEGTPIRRSFSMAEILTLLIGSIPLTLIMLTPGSPQ
jgi:hypothetical protein